MREGETMHASLLSHKVHDLRSDLTGILRGGKMAAAGKDFQLRLRDHAVHFLALMKGHDAMLRTPCDQFRHLKTRQQVV